LRHASNQTYRAWPAIAFLNPQAAPGTQLLAFFEGLGDAKTGRALHIRLSMGTVGQKIAVGGSSTAAAFSLSYQSGPRPGN
jgi:hypothetical protein